MERSILPFNRRSMDKMANRKPQQMLGLLSSFRKIYLELVLQSQTAYAIPAGKTAHHFHFLSPAHILVPRLRYAFLVPARLKNANINSCKSGGTSVYSGTSSRKPHPDVRITFIVIIKVAYALANPHSYSLTNSFTDTP